MSKKIDMQTEPKKDKIIYAQKSNRPSTISSVSGAFVGYLALLSIVYGVVSFSRPDYIIAASKDKLATALVVIGVGIFLIALSAQLAILGRSSFEKGSNAIGRLGFTSSLSKVNQIIMQMAGFTFAPLDDVSGLDDKVGVRNEGRELKIDPFSYGAAAGDSSFEIYMSNVLKSLSSYAASSEVTATKLLDKGVAFMAGGLVFYIVAIVVWQVFANLTHPDVHVMYVGMAACSMTFIVVEFLAAWFFKQYRYYVEVSLSCLRVRSVYDRYLLNFYALREFQGDHDERTRNQMAEILKEDVNWPTFKKSVANDFNYMIESMSAAHTSLDKMKDLFQPKKKPKAKTPVEEV
ncbi:hypothetical protein C4K09_1237 [Pseudomonas chlororaphis subsp. aureofaciens]|nr:hypothetical protein C4K09_1237 [Pseudomonas chlororaphis subsp. aureofaciens]